MIIWQLVSLSAIILVLLNIFIDVDICSQQNLIAILLLGVFVLMCYILDGRRYDTIRGKIIRPSWLLVFGMCIIVFQNPIDLLLNNLHLGSAIFVHQNLIVKGVAYGTIAIASFTLGYILAYRPFSTANKAATPASLRLFAVLLVLSMAGFLLTIDADFFSGKSYVESGDISTSHTKISEVLLWIAFNGYFIQYAINSRGKGLSFREYVGGIPIFILLIFVGYLSLKLVSGMREPVLRNILLFVFSYIYASRRSPMKATTFIVSLIVASFVFSIVSIGRGVITDDLSEKYRVGMEVYDDRNSISPTTSELANSQYCDFVAIKHFDKEENQHLGGAIQARYIASTFIPNRILNNFWDVETDMQGSAYFLTARDRGLKAESGLGSTIHTDFYVDFGIVGMILCMVLVGFIFKKTDLTLYSNASNRYSLLVTVLVICLGASSFYLSRSVFIPTLKIPLYTYILLIINQRFSLSSNK